MLRTSSNVTQEQMAVGYEGAKVEVGVETYASSEVTLPPVSKLLRGERIPAKPQHASVSHVDKSIQRALEPELDRLLAKRDRFGNSSTYLAQASGLAVICERLDEAQQLVDNALGQTKEDNRDLAYRQASVAFHRRDEGTARVVWTRLAEGGDLLSCLRMVELCVLDADFERANAWLQRAMDLDSLDWRVHTLAGTLALVAGEGGKSVHHHRLAIAERPRSVRLHYTLALAHASNGHLANALRAIKIAASLDPFGKATLVAWADLCCEDGSSKAFGDASRALARFLELYPDEESVVKRHALLLYKQGHFRAARRVLSDARRRLQDSAIVNNLGVLAAHANNHALAVREFSNAKQLAISGRDRELATANLVQALFEANFVDRAATIAETHLDMVGENEVLTGDPGYRVADVLVHSYVQQHKMPEAISLAKRWLRRETHPELQTTLAEVLGCYYSLVDVQPERAYEYALIAHERQSSLSMKGRRWKQTLNNLVFTLIGIDRLSEAKNLAARLDAGGGDVGASINATRGLLAIRLGHVEKGEALYRKGISLAVSRDLKARIGQRLGWELGAYWMSQGDPNKAKRFLRRAAVVEREDVWPMQDIKRRALELMNQP